MRVDGATSDSPSFDSASIRSVSDCNDADRLRSDALLQLACGTEGIELSSQPTLTRFENGVSWAELKQLWLEFERQYVESLDPTTRSVVLDIDGTDDPTHGGQQLSFFHGFYDQHMFHPLLVFDGDSGQLITAVLRAGNAHAARGAAGILRRLIRAIKHRCPNAMVLVRGDSAFGVPRILDLHEQLSDELGDVHTSSASPRIHGSWRSQRLSSRRPPRRSSAPTSSFASSNLTAIKRALGFDRAA